MRRLVPALVIATVVGVVVAVSSASPATTTPLRYIALGDSYSAASGVLPIDVTSPTRLRSTRNYPHVIAAKIGAALTDVTCGAADTSDFAASQNSGVDPQLDALRADTQLVTMTIGGNDNSVFLGAILTCGSAGVSTLGQGSPCKDQYGSSFTDTINTTTYPALVTALTAVKATSPQAKIATLRHPEIVPPTTGCFPQIALAVGDVPYLHVIQKSLNSAVSRAAKATQVTSVDFSKVSAGHDACKPIGTRWIEPVLLGTNPVIVHPNGLGEAKMAEQAMKVLKLS